MTKEILETTAEFMQKHGINPATVLEFGSYNVNGTQRVNFQSSKYIGIDIEAGSGVDIVADITATKEVIHNLPISHINPDLLICCETLEHIPIFWNVLELIDSLSLDNYILLSFPTLGFPYHAYPIDCNRFTMDAVNGWAKHFNWTIIDHRAVTDYAGLPCLVILLKNDKR